MTSDPIKSLELLPCPFCGETGGIMKAHGVYQAFCSDSSCPANGTYNTLEEAAKAWNTRTEAPRLLALIKRQREALEFYATESYNLSPGWGKIRVDGGKRARAVLNDEGE